MNSRGDIWQRTAPASCWKYLLTCNTALRGLWKIHKNPQDERNQLLFALQPLDGFRIDRLSGLQLTALRYSRFHRAGSILDSNVAFRTLLELVLWGFLPPCKFMWRPRCIDFKSILPRIQFQLDVNQSKSKQHCRHWMCHSRIRKDGSLKAQSCSSLKHVVPWGPWGDSDSILAVTFQCLLAVRHLPSCFNPKQSVMRIQALWMIDTHEHILYKMRGVKACHISFYVPPAAAL